MQRIQADIIIAGGGLAGLTLAVECANYPFFDDKRIIILDRDDKTRNDRTWCFWSDDTDEIPPVVHHSWDNCRFYGADFERMLDIAPYRYHMIRGIDFYQWAKSVIGKKSNIEWIKADIQSIDAAKGMVHTSVGALEGGLVFNAALRERIESPHPNARFTQLLQHFTGWHIQTAAPQFDSNIMTFMDYRVEQQGDTRFVYVLPFSPTEALVEFTVFSPSVCSPDEYARELNSYIQKHLGITEFTIKETEFGVIPMADVPLKIRECRVVHIGTAGGFVKGSSGYAFKRTQQKLKTFVKDWAETGIPHPELMRSGWRYRFYDSVMLSVLKNNAVPGSQFFSQLFERLPAAHIFRFLDEDSTFAADLRLLSIPPTWPFFKTAVKQIPILSKI